MIFPSKKISPTYQKWLNRLGYVFLPLFIMFLYYRDEFTVSNKEWDSAYSSTIFLPEDAIKNITKNIVYISPQKLGGRTGGRPTIYKIYIEREEWTDERNKQYKDIFFNWAVMNMEETEFCRNGVLAKLERNAGIYLKKEVGLISMEVQKRRHGVCWVEDIPVQRSIFQR